jgi:hypothetical protein
MRISRSLAVVLILSAEIAACGGGGSKQTPVDAKLDIDASTADAAVTGPDAAATPAGCDYGEQMDANNDDTYATSGSAETTNLTLNATPLVLCGDINAGHYDATDMLVDYDAYTIAVGTEGDALLELSAPGAAALDAVNVQVYDSNGDFVVEADFIGDHGAASMHLPADTYEVDVAAFNSVAISATSHYQVKISPEVFDTRCPVGSVVGYTESHDGAGGTGNDMVDVSYDQNGAAVAVLTAATTDTVEATGITVGSSTNYLIDGSSTTVIPRATESYLDEDTYSFTTGAATNQIAIRVDWATAGSDDYDWFLFEENSANIVASSNTTSTSGPEADTISVNPSTAYWLWVSPFNTSTVSESYQLTICGESFVAP